MFICQCGYVFIEEIDYSEQYILFIVLSARVVISRSHIFLPSTQNIPTFSPKTWPSSWCSDIQLNHSFINHCLNNSDVPKCTIETENKIFAHGLAKNREKDHSYVNHMKSITILF